jgi:hypothetical protein
MVYCRDITFMGKKIIGILRILQKIIMYFWGKSIQFFQQIQLIMKMSEHGYCLIMIKMPLVLK